MINAQTTGLEHNFMESSDQKQLQGPPLSLELGNAERITSVRIIVKGYKMNAKMNHQIKNGGRDWELRDICKRIWIFVACISKNFRFGWYKSESSRMSQWWLVRQTGLEELHFLVSRMGRPILSLIPTANRRAATESKSLAIQARVIPADSLVRVYPFFTGMSIIQCVYCVQSMQYMQYLHFM